MNLSLGFEDLPVRRQSDVAAAVERFRELKQRPDSPIREIRHQPEREPVLAPMPAEVLPTLANGLAARGIGQLYSHQAAAFEAVTAGRNAVVVTPTASG